jgi:hypothetical protein
MPRKFHRLIPFTSSWHSHALDSKLTVRKPTTLYSHFKGHGASIHKRIRFSWPLSRFRLNWETFWILFMQMDQRLLTKASFSSLIRIVHPDVSVCWIRMPHRSSGREQSQPRTLGWCLPWSGPVSRIAKAYFSHPSAIAGQSGLASASGKSIEANCSL